MATSAVLNAQTNRLPPAPTLQPAPADVTFLRDAWYIVGWSDEFTTAPVARTILGENLSSSAIQKASWRRCATAARTVSRR